MARRAVEQLLGPAVAAAAGPGDSLPTLHCGRLAELGLPPDVAARASKKRDVLMREALPRFWLGAPPLPADTREVTVRDVPAADLPEVLQPLPALERLQLAQTSLARPPADLLAPVGQLRALQIDFTKAGGALFAQLATHCPLLRVLQARKTQPDAEGLAGLPPGLVTLDLAACGLSDRHVAAVCAAAPALRSLDVSENVLATPAFALVAELSQLEVFRASYTRLNVAGARFLARGVPRLRVLAAAHTPLCDEGLLLLVRGLRGLRSLDVASTGAGAVSLGRAAAELPLDALSCGGRTQEAVAPAVARLLERRPRASVLVARDEDRVALNAARARGLLRQRQQLVLLCSAVLSVSADPQGLGGRIAALPRRVLRVVVELV